MESGQAHKDLTSLLNDSGKLQHLRLFMAYSFISHLLGKFLLALMFL